MRGVYRIISICIGMISIRAGAQDGALYPPNTKWYQDPLGFRPVELSSAVGFAWGSAAVTACLLFTKKDSLLRSKIYFYDDAGASFGFKPPYTRSLQNNLGILYSIRQWMATGSEFNAEHFSDGINNTFAVGIRPFARWYFFRRRKVRLFFEYGAGVSYSLHRFPLTGTGLKADTTRSGTQFNFTTKYGTGAECRLSDKLILQGGLRHFHLSNGNISGVLRNPSYDGNGAFIGLLYTLFNAPKF